MQAKRRSRNDKRKRKLELRQLVERTEDLTPSELIAAKQGRAIIRHNQLVVKTPRLNFTYRIGDYIIPSGKKHRTIG